MLGFLTGHIYIRIMPHCLADKNHVYINKTAVCCAIECPIIYNLDWMYLKRYCMHFRSCKLVKYSARYAKKWDSAVKMAAILKMAAIFKNGRCSRGSPGRFDKCSVWNTDAKFHACITFRKIVWVKGPAITELSIFLNILLLWGKIFSDVLFKLNTLS